MVGCLYDVSFLHEMCHTEILQISRYTLLYNTYELDCLGISSVYHASSNSATGYIAHFILSIVSIGIILFLIQEAN